MTRVEISLTFSLRNTCDIPSRSNSKRNKQYRLTVNWHASIYLLPYAAPIRSSVCQRTEFPKRTMISGRRIFSPLPLPPFLISSSHLPLGLLFLLSPIFHCHKIKDGGYNNTNMNKVSPTQNTPALQADSNAPAQHVINIHGFKLECSLFTLENWYWAFHIQAQVKFFLECSVVKQ